MLLLLQKLLLLWDIQDGEVGEPKNQDERNSGNKEFLKNVVKKNVELTVKNLKNESRVLRLKAEDPSQLIIVGAVYSISTAVVTSFNDKENA
jgi:carbonic anhydrase